MPFIIRVAAVLSLTPSGIGMRTSAGMTRTSE